MLNLLGSKPMTFTVIEKEEKYYSYNIDDRHHRIDSHRHCGYGVVLLRKREVVGMKYGCDGRQSNHNVPKFDLLE